MKFNTAGTPAHSAAPIILLLVMGLASSSPAQQSQPRAIASPGENETTALSVCEEFALTAKEGKTRSAGDAKAASQDPITRFAQSLVSSGATGADRSTRVPDSPDSHLFHGYYFRRLTGISADGANNKGLALVAYPAEYQSSGVKTFLVTKKGLVFEKDLGPDTAKVAPNISLRTSGWRPAE